MTRALELAAMAFPDCSPNPAVGSVIVFDDLIIGEGFTQKYGGSHAEVMAINSVGNKELLKNSTMYVTMEPCNHFGKTPPCTHAILNAEIPSVFIAATDPFNDLDKPGITFLKTNGIEINVGQLEEKALYLNKRFYTFHKSKRPYVILKWAESKDGFIAPERKSEEKGIHWITQSETRQHTHKLRSEEMAILVGKNTALFDDPSLTTRSIEGKNPTRILIDRILEVPEKSNIFNKDAKTYVFNEKYNSSREQVHYIKADFKENVPKQILSFLYEMDITSLIVEGGARTLENFIQNDLWDEAMIYSGLGDLKKGIKAPELSSKEGCYIKIGKDTLNIVVNDK